MGAEGRREGQALPAAECSSAPAPLPHPSSLSAAVPLTQHQGGRSLCLSPGWGQKGREKESGQVKADWVQEFLGDWLKNTCVEGGLHGEVSAHLSYSLGNELALADGQG